VQILRFALPSDAEDGVRRKVEEHDARGLDVFA
jgi:hypothetical protein